MLRSALPQRERPGVRRQVEWTRSSQKESLGSPLNFGCACPFRSAAQIRVAPSGRRQVAALTNPAGSQGPQRGLRREAAFLCIVLLHGPQRPIGGVNPLRHLELRSARIQPQN